MGCRRLFRSASAPRPPSILPGCRQFPRPRLAICSAAVWVNRAGRAPVLASGPLAHGAHATRSLAPMNSCGDMAPSWHASCWLGWRPSRARPLLCRHMKEMLLSSGQLSSPS
ncbi:hypothetical protein BS78_03G347100 [Paspalum vaginatum]|nr:hypothetical protein BS78_03G347100 [Paspalum vaginatum]